MIARLFGPVLALAALTFMFYASPFWPFRLWQGNLLGLPGLGPEGNLVAVWVSGTPFETFDLILWAIGGFALLTLLENVIARLTHH